MHVTIWHVSCKMPRFFFFFLFSWSAIFLFGTGSTVQNGNLFARGMGLDYRIYWLSSWDYLEKFLKKVECRNWCQTTKLLIRESKKKKFYNDKGMLFLIKRNMNQYMIAYSNDKSNLVS